MIKKIICATDLLWHLMLPLVATAYVVLQNGVFATQMMWICWLPYIIYVTFSLAGFKEFPNVTNSVLSLLNVSFLVLLYVFRQLSLLDFFLSVVLAELVAISVAISYFFLFEKGLDGMRATDIFGKRGAIMLALFFMAISYPYFGEIALHIKNNGMGLSMICAFSFTLILGVRSQIKSIHVLVNRRNENLQLHKRSLEKSLDSSQPMDWETRAILIALGIWFLGIGFVWVVYVYNA